MRRVDANDAGRAGHLEPKPGAEIDLKHAPALNGARRERRIRKSSDGDSNRQMRRQSARGLEGAMGQRSAERGAVLCAQVDDAAGEERVSAKKRVARVSVARAGP